MVLLDWLNMLISSISISPVPSILRDGSSYFIAGIIQAFHIVSMTENSQVRILTDLPKKIVLGLKKKKIASHV